MRKTWGRVGWVGPVAPLCWSYFFVDLLGFNEGVLPGVSLLSRRRLSGSPVDLAMGFGPGFKLMMFSF